MTTKVCSKCKKTKDISCFYPHVRDKRRSVCKECHLSLKKQRYAENPEPSRAKNRERQHKVGRWQKTRHKYGIGEKEYNELLVKQRGYCAICGVHQTNLKQPLGVDHNHETGKVRGLLCLKCNFAIGYLQEDTRIILAALRYLETNK